MQKLAQYIPIFGWLSDYDRSFLQDDIGAGITVGIMLIPQGMAYAMLAGLPPIYGLYAAIFPQIMYAIFGTCRQLAVGPVALDSILVASGVGVIATAGSTQYIQLAILLALMVGLIQLVMGIFKLGFLVNFLSRPVISGFTSGAAIIIALSQLKHLLGLEVRSTSYVHEIIQTTFAQLHMINLPTLLLGLSGIGLILFLKKIKSLLPSALVAVILGILIVYFSNLSEAGVAILGTIPAGLPNFGLPDFSIGNLQQLAPIAFSIAFIGFMESIAIGRTFQTKHGNYRIRPNQELIALGVANLAGSFFKAFPTTGGFSRSAVNDHAGAKTGVAALVSAGMIVLTLLFFTPLFYYLPNAILAAIIIVAVCNLIDFSTAKNLWQQNRRDFWMLIVTFLGTLFLGIQMGIAIGVVLSLALMIYDTTNPHIAVLGKIPDNPHYRNIGRFDELECQDHILIVRFDARLYYANCSFFYNELWKLVTEKGNQLQLVILDAVSINDVDSSGIAILKELANAL
ncbi:MAG: solute carrier family 26 protein, partial [Bacteroidota bacterium]